MSSSVEQVRIKIWFEWCGPHHHGIWWKEISFIPPIGTGVVLFDEEEADDWGPDHDDIEVVGQVYLAQQNLVVVTTENDFSTLSPPRGFREAMLKAGWTETDAELWD